MSPRTDYILSLCLEQAEKSPLHYRHGSVIIRGGKVIGLGHNSYRPGFDGGALKTGILPLASDTVGAAELKARLKCKSKHKSKSNPPSHPQFHPQQSNHTFVAFEKSQGHVTNAPLSMHSEMMAIHAAMSLSPSSAQTSARMAQWLKKPRGSVRGGSKRKARSRTLKLYVQTVCAEAEEACDRVNLENGDNNKGGNRNQARNKKGKKELMIKQGRISYGSSTPGSSSSSGVSSDQDIEDHFGTHEDHTSRQHSSSKSKSKIEQRSQPSVVSKHPSRSSKSDITSRMKDNRLKGADLYVARLGTTHDSPPSVPPVLPTPASLFRAPPATGSLHDELTSHNHGLVPPLLAEDPQQRPIRASRPCYRCITYMHAVGIKRVFWTNADGGWDGAKVRDLVDALEGDSEGECGEHGEKGLGVFVTKHEVLMMRRMMENC